MSSKNLYEYKKAVNKLNTRNFKFVTIRNNRNCMYCGDVIPSGTECLTVNKKFNGREWACDDCIQKILNYQEALAHQNSVAFGDEGAAMAMAEWVSECAELLDEIGFFDDDWEDY